MHSHAIKIGKFYHAHDGAQEDHTLTYSPEEFKELRLKGKIEVRLKLIRVEEGIMVVIENVEAIQEALCIQCGKSLEVPYDVQPSEWLFYESKPLAYDDENEFLFFDKPAMELDPTEAIRQELILNQAMTPRCKKPCRILSESQEEGTKALSGLKDLLS